MADLRSRVLQQLQALTFDSPLENGTASDKADILRCILGDIHIAGCNQMITEEGRNLVSKSFQESYINIIDSLDEDAGLNNYAEGALSLCSMHKNESQKWQSSLNKENITKLPSVAAVLQQSKNLSKTEISDNKILFTKSRLSNSSNQKQVRGQPTSEFHSLFGQEQLRNRGSCIAAQHTAAFVPDINFHSSEQNRNVSSFNRISSSNNFSAQNGSSECDTNLVTTNLSSVKSRLGGGVFRREGEPWMRDNFTASRDTDNRKPLFKTGNNGTSSSVFGEYGSAVGNTRPSDRGWQENQGGRLKRPYQDSDADEEKNQAAGVFRTAKEQYNIDSQKKYNRDRGHATSSGYSYGTNKKSLGTRRGPSSKFVPPVLRPEQDGDEGPVTMDAVQRSVVGKGKSSNSEEPSDPRLKGIDQKMIELVMNEIMDHGPQVGWDDIAGLEFAKKTIKEIVVWPMLRPDIFTGLRGPPKGLLLFGPPGTGKTLIGKCIAGQSKSTFFSISASSLTSKWVGEGEKMVRALFAVARCHQPAVVFIDEIDSLLSQRSDGEHEASRRIKTEFLVQLDGAATISEDRILVIGATNRPQEIDEAARRRFVKRLYIPLPETLARRQIVLNLLTQQHYQLQDSELDVICQRSGGYSGADMANLCREAALGPIRSMPFADIENISADQVRPILYEDFEEALLQVRASVSDKDLDLYIQWNTMYGSASIKK